jgi:hypothetical protein
MANKDTIKTLIGGAVIGAILTIAVGFGSGWLIASNTRDGDVAAAWIDAQASVCSSLVQDHRSKMGDVSDITGYASRSARTELAQTYAVALTGEDAADPAVIRACANNLDT